VLAVVVHPNGKTIASGGADGTIKFWDATRSEMTASVESGHISVNFVAFSPGGDWLVSGGTDQIVRFWELGEARTSRPGE
jgi:WD40 repeat protein